MDIVEKVKNDPNFKELVEKRNSFSLKLTIAMLVVYYSFILIIAFDKSILAAKISETTTLGIPVGVAIILISFGLTGIYVKRANSEFDELTEKIKQNVKKGSK
jgi:uncharacterized membrane protein (DUF485 family)